MESVVSPEEEFKLDTPVPVPHLNLRKGPLSLEEVWKTAAVNSVTSYNYGRECKNEIVTETEDSNNRSVKPSSHSGM